MKYVVLIPLGAADHPLEELGDRTPLEAAATPNLDTLARMGRVGAAYNTPEGWIPGGDLGVMSTLGYSPAKYHTGRAPFEALAQGLAPAPHAWVMRLSLVSTGQPGSEHEGRLIDPSAGEITSGEAATLYSRLVEAWATALGDRLRGVRVVPGAGYRGILIDDSGRDYARVRLPSPREIVGESWRQHLPSGDESAALLREMIELSEQCLRGSEVNLARIEQGLPPATLVWPWGLGTTPQIPSIRGVFGVRSAMLSTIDLFAGLGAALGMSSALDEPAATRHALSDEEIGRETVRAINAFDLVCVVVDTADQAARRRDAPAKVAAIESFDRHILGPVLAALTSRAESQAKADAAGWRLLVSPAHATLTVSGATDAMPVPVVMAGNWISGVVQRPFSEAESEQSDLQIDPGHELMEYFLNAGVPLTHRVSHKESPLK